MKKVQFLEAKIHEEKNFHPAFDTAFNGGSARMHYRPEPYPYH